MNELAYNALLEACKEFVRKVECGEARSIRSYAQMKVAIALHKKEENPDQLNLQWEKQIPERNENGN